MHAVGSGKDLLDTAARYLVDAGGKRLRPFMVLLAAEFGGGRNADVVAAAVASELTHIRTPYHDDVMDGAATRRCADRARRVASSATICACSTARRLGCSRPPASWAACCPARHPR